MAEFNEIGSGGVLASGAGQNRFVFFPAASGGVLADGTNTPSYTLAPRPSGGVSVAGSATVRAIYSIRASGGAACGGSGRAPQTHIITASGGVLCGGTSKPNVPTTVVASGGILVSGSGNESFMRHVRGSGGVLVSGASVVEQPIYHYPTSPIPSNQIQIGGGVENLTIKRFGSSTGGVVTGGSAKLVYRVSYLPTGNSNDEAPVTAGVRVGSQTVANLTFAIDFGFKWRVNTYITIDTTFLWNTGKLKQYWYRIIGKGKTNGCPPVDVNDPCCQKFIMNVHARTLDDLCRKLKERQWKWPIQSVQRFSIPAETAVQREEEAAGIKHDCNRTEVVDICKHSLCADFCVDIDAVDYWGSYTTSQVNAFHEYEMLGGAFVGGFADATFEKNLFKIRTTASGGVATSGAAEYISTGYTFTGTGGVVPGSTTIVKCSTFKFTGGEYPYETKATNPSSASQIQRQAGDVIWSLTGRAFKSDDLWSTSDLSYAGRSNMLILSRFNFAIPTGMRILGIQVFIERHATSAVRDLEVVLLSGGEVLTDNLANLDVNWPIALDSTVTYGGFGTTWREDEWDVADINSTTFGLGLRIQGLNNVSGVIARLDTIQVRIYYEDPVHQQVRVAGTIDMHASDYQYREPVGGIGLGGSALGGMRATYKVKTIGKGSVGPEFSSINMGGQYAKNLHYNDVSGGVEIGGDATSKSSYWAAEGEGEVVTGGSARIRSSNFHWQTEGDITLESLNTMRASYSYNTVGGVAIGGDYTNLKRLGAVSSGGVTTSGNAFVRSSAFFWSGTFGVSTSGEAEYRFSDFGTIETFIGFNTTAENMLVLFGTDSDNVAAIAAPTQTLTKCQCSGMPLTIPFNHNMFLNNKLAQFLKRNNIQVPTTGGLLYNRTNDSWQSNQHYRGFSPNNITKELWNIIYELQCTNLIGGQVIGENVWKLSTLIVLKDLVTLEEYDTRIVVGFLPDKVCKADEPFRANITVDTIQGFAVIDPNATVYQTLVYDDIGLFKNSYWIDNPNVIFKISQSGIIPNAPRYPLNISA
jgi:hypothetical protein